MNAAVELQDRGGGIRAVTGGGTQPGPRIATTALTPTLTTATGGGTGGVPVITGGGGEDQDNNSSSTLNAGDITGTTKAGNNTDSTAGSPKPAQPLANHLQNEHRGDGSGGGGDSNTNTKNVHPSNKVGSDTSSHAGRNNQNKCAKHEGNKQVGMVGQENNRLKSSQSQKQLHQNTINTQRNTKTREIKQQQSEDSPDINVSGSSIDPLTAKNATTSVETTGSTATVQGSPEQQEKHIAVVQNDDTTTTNTPPPPAATTPTDTQHTAVDPCPPPAGTCAATEDNQSTNQGSHDSIVKNGLNSGRTGSNNNSGTSPTAGRVKHKRPTSLTGPDPLGGNCLGGGSSKPQNISSNSSQSPQCQDTGGGSPALLPVTRAAMDRPPMLRRLLAHPTIEEEEEENFVLNALLCATDEGNLSGVRELLETATNFDLNQANKHGETALHMAASGGHLEIIKYLYEKGSNIHATDKHGDSMVYWAARQGHVHVIEYLKGLGVDLNTQNKAGEAAVHVAARYGHTDVIEYLCTAECDVNKQDKMGESPLHHAAWHGLPAHVCYRLCLAGCDTSSTNKEGETPLHCAAARGNLDCVKVLLDGGVNLNAADKRGSTPLHLACRRHHTAIALLLLHTGCQFDIADHLQETALHSASREGLLPVVQTLCALGCRLDVVSKAGVTPLHLAARGGHTEVVRCLLLSGAEPDLPNKEGVTAEIMALAQGHNDIAELLTKLKPERREVFMRQLMPTNTPLNRIKVKVFGHSGAGKSTIVDSLKCGYFGSFFRKARLTSSSSVTNKQKCAENGFQRHHSLPSQLSYDVTNEAYTKGIDVQQVNINGAGELSIWDFSGYEPYFMLYDHFIGDPNCIHMVVFSLTEPPSVQLTQVMFWLQFIKARIPAFEPIGTSGRQPWPAHVVLVGTHADKAGCTKNARGEFTSDDASMLLATVQEKLALDFTISDHIFVVDAHLAMSVDLKLLRSHLGDLKANVVKSLPTSNGFLDAVVATLPAWRKTTASYPVLPWPNFIEFVRSRVNTLASEEHMKEVMHQLQLLGEVVYLETESEQDLVVLCPKWLCTEVIGELLSHDRLTHSRPTGCFTSDDFQLMFPETESQDLLRVLEALEVCTQCDIDGDIEYEFPCLNFVETLQGLWEKDTRRYRDAVYGGVRIQCPRGVTNQLVHLMPRIQVHLRRTVLQEENPAVDLYQWYHGSKYCSGLLESLITLEQGDQVIEIKARGLEDERRQLFLFFEEVLAVVDQVLEDLCPGFLFEKHLLSPTHLRTHDKTVHSYAPRTILQMQMAGSSMLQLDEEDKEEDFRDVAVFGSQDIADVLTAGVDLHISHLSVHTRRLLAQRLDPPDPTGHDWCMLAVTLRLTETVPQLDDVPHRHPESRTDRTMEEWSRDPSSTIQLFIQKLRELDRPDVIDSILNTGPLFKVFHDDLHSSSHNDLLDDELGGAPTTSSNNTLSSVSR